MCRHPALYVQIVKIQECTAGIPGEEYLEKQREEQRAVGGIVVPVVPDLPLPRLFVEAMKFGKAVTSEPDNAATERSSSRYLETTI